MKKVLFSVFCLFLGFILSGCGDSEKKYTLTGVVSYQGKPVEEGAISFVPADASQHTDGAEIHNGQYSCDVTPGMKTVRITGSKRVPPKKGDDPTLVLYEDYIPRQFNLDSSLSVNVEKSAEENFELK